MIRRIRPLRRALVGGAVATAAYQGGRRRAAGNYQAEQTDARLGQLEAQQASAPAPVEQYAPAPTAPVAAPAPPVDRLDELAKLADLNKMGVLSEEEFASEKARILAS